MTEVYSSAGGLDKLRKPHIKRQLRQGPRLCSSSYKYDIDNQHRPT